MPNVRRLLVDQGHHVRGRGRLLPALLPGASDLHHRPVRAQPRRRRQLLPVRLVRHEEPGQHPPRMAPEGRATAPALIGKWLNGYGALDAHGEVPKGFDIWRGLLDVSAYDYYNFVMNRNGKLQRRGATEASRASSSKFANIEVTPNPGGLAGGAEQAQRGLRAAAVPLLGNRRSRRTTRRTSPAGSPSSSSRAERHATQAVLHLVGARCAAPRGRGHDADGSAGPRSAPRAALQGAEQPLRPAAPAELQRARHLRQAVQHHATTRRR